MTLNQNNGQLEYSGNQFKLNEFIQLCSELKIVKSSMNYQNAKDLITLYIKYDSLFVGFTNKTNTFLKNLGLSGDMLP